MGRYLGIVAILLCWGLWAFLPKITVGYVSARQALLFHMLGGLAVGFIASDLDGFDFNRRTLLGAALAFSTGVFAAVGMAIYYRMATTENVSVMAVVTALYPLVAVALAVMFLNEELTWKQGLASVLALASIVLFAS